VHRSIQVQLTILLLLGTAAGCAAQDSPAQALPIMRKVCDWQLSQLSTEKVAVNDNDGNWIRAVFYNGDMALYRATQDSQYLDPMMKIAQECNWEMDPNRFRHADGLAIGQLYTELYFVKKDPAMLKQMAGRWDRIMDHPIPGHLDWWWCDALYMDPPALARLAAATGQKKYLDYMDKQFWDTSDYLYDKSEHLMFRDKSFFNKTEPNGKKVFWSRGNGWVLAGIARILQYMPADYPSRGKYITLFKEMSQRVAGLQQADGYWRMSLLDPEASPGGEGSGTALFCYAMAWGVNEKILPAEQYRPVIDKAWKALVGSIEPSGKMGWVQLPGSKPGAVKKTDTAEYGPGAFLMAGCEVMKLGDARNGS
jgi:unsaturated rhamnogalacturonyl hydrolase